MFRRYQYVQARLIVIWAWKSDTDSTFRRKSNLIGF